MRFFKNYTVSVRVNDLNTAFTLKFSDKTQARAEANNFFTTYIKAGFDNWDVRVVRRFPHQLIASYGVGYMPMFKGLDHLINPGLSGGGSNE